jgi:hypothetical protein
VQLASLVSPPKPETEAPALQYALAPAAPDAPVVQPARPTVVQASYDAKPARLVLTGFPETKAGAPAEKAP